jgi:hypothetical protein
MKRLGLCLALFTAGCASTAISNDPASAKYEYNQGTAYLYGKGIPKNYKAAESWLLKSAEHGNADAQYALGWMYMSDEYSMKDSDKALKWLTESASQGSPDGEAALGMIYEAEGKYGPAFDLFSKAARQGNASGQYLLGSMLIYGKGGVSIHRVEGEEFLRKAAAQGHEPAKKLLASLSKVQADCGALYMALDPNMKPQRNCIYTNGNGGELTINQVVPGGALVSAFEVKERVIFVRPPKGLENDLVDGAKFPAGRYIFNGTFSYESVFGRRTVYSFKPFTPPGS